MSNTSKGTLLSYLNNFFYVIVKNISTILLKNTHIQSCIDTTIKLLAIIILKPINNSQTLN